MECLDTKEDAINLVKSVFQSMGGRVLPPPTIRRPRHIDKYDHVQFVEHLNRTKCVQDSKFCKGDLKHFFMSGTIWL